MVSWVRNIFCLYLFVSFIMQLLLNDKYKKYIRLFAGIVMILLMLGPLTGLIASEDEQKKYYEDIFVWDDSQRENYKMLLGAAGDSYDLVLQAYTDGVIEQIDSMIAEYGYKLSKQDIIFNLDDQDDNYGRIECMNLELVHIDNSLVEPVIIDIDLDEENQSNTNDNYEEIIIKNKLANFYSIAACNININIYE